MNSLYAKRAALGGRDDDSDSDDESDMMLLSVSSGSLGLSSSHNDKKNQNYHRNDLPPSPPLGTKTFQPQSQASSSKNKKKKTHTKPQDEYYEEEEEGSLKSFPPPPVASVDFTSQKLPQQPSRPQEQDDAGRMDPSSAPAPSYAPQPQQGFHPVVQQVQAPQANGGGLPTYYDPRMVAMAPQQQGQAPQVMMMMPAAPQSSNMIYRAPTSTLYPTTAATQQPPGMDNSSYHSDSMHRRLSPHSSQTSATMNYSTTASQLPPYHAGTHKHPDATETYRSHESSDPWEEEYVAAQKEKDKEINRFLLFGLAFLCCFFLGLTAAIVGVTLTKQGTSTTTIYVEPQDPSTTTTAAPTVTQTTAAPTAPPTTLAYFQEQNAPTATPTTLAPTFANGFDPRNFELYAYIANFFTDDNGATIREPDSPQQRAYYWLEQDALNNPEFSEERLVQRYALATFYYATNGDQWTRNNLWLDPIDECLWQTDSTTGTNCDFDDNIVTRIEMDKNNVGGTLPPELGLLGRLSTLYIINEPLNRPEYAKLTGTLPSLLGHMSSMNSLTIKNQNFTGTVPPELFLEWGQADWIMMERCKLIGSLPSTVGLLRSATKFSFRKNDMTGTIPTEVGLMTQMKQFSVDANFMVGTIPTEFGSMTDGKGIWVNKNQLNGTIPTEFGNMPLIKAGLRFSDNQLVGTIPTELGLLVDMKSFEVQNNQLTGPVPDFGALTNLKTLWDIRNNDLTGTVTEATCESILEFGAEAYADCSEVSCPCCTNCQ